MSEADDLAIRRASAAAADAQARVDAAITADETLLAAFPAKAREVLAILERRGFAVEEMRLLRMGRLARRRTRFREAEYTFDERAGWLLNRFHRYVLDDLVSAHYWLVSDGTIALSGDVDDVATPAGAVDMREEFYEWQRRDEVRAAYEALQALGARYT